MKPLNALADLACVVLRCIVGKSHLFPFFRAKVIGEQILSSYLRILSEHAHCLAHCLSGDCWVNGREKIVFDTE